MNEREQTTLEKLRQAQEDPFAAELAKRLAIAALTIPMGEPFDRLYEKYGEYGTGNLWQTLTIICIEDKKFGQGLPDSILAHPLLERVPQLRNIDAGRRDNDTVALARRFQAAYATMEGLSTDKPDAGINSFTKSLSAIDAPESLWIVLAGLHQILQAKSLQNPPKQ
jgi:hypothetical protein